MSIGTPGIRLVQGTEAISRPLGELYSTRSAYEQIMHADTVQFPREVMARCNLNKYLEPNLLVDSMKTTAAREDVLASVSPASGMVQSGQRIIDRGEIISAEQYQILKSFEHETLRRAAARAMNSSSTISTLSITAHSEACSTTLPPSTSTARPRVKAQRKS